MKCFTSNPILKPGVFARILGRPLKENAFREIENLLTGEVTKVSTDDIDDILDRYKCTFEDSKVPFAELFKKAVTFCAEDSLLTEEETRELNHLRKILKISDEQASEIRLSVVLPIFNQMLEAAIAGRAIRAENDRLKTIASNLSIPDELIQSAAHQQACRVFAREFSEATVDKRLSPDEESRLQSLLTQFRGQNALDENTQAQWDYFKKLWKYSQGDFDEISTDLRLQKGERCVFWIGADHYQVKTVTRRIRYCGPTASIRIMKGVRWRIGDLAVSRVTEDVRKKVGSGILYVTSKRLLFDGTTKNSSITLGRIVNFTCFDNALLIEKSTGSDEVFTFQNGDPAALSAILEGLLKQN